MGRGLARAGASTVPPNFRRAGACSLSSRRTSGASASLRGIARAKAEGVYKGRPASIDADRVRELKAQGMGPTAIAEALKIGRASVYRVLELPLRRADRLRERLLKAD
jgi:hypothetical protein